MDISIVIIPANRNEKARLEEVKDYTYMSGQFIVGGAIGAIEMPNTGATLWCNEEGLLLGLPLNRQATSYLWTIQPEHVGYSGIVGDCYITGPADADGNTLSVPDSVIDFWK